ncbi:phage holin family protein [Streptomyces sp. NPDC091272]|uniref:phage holin family protein n=1 Tax=Streptomyces sp. NPDC091272 TaxID=3365981 RepID=UPI00380574A6
MAEGRWRRIGWRRAGGALLRLVAVWVVSTLTMLALAGLLPDFQLQSDDDESLTSVALTAVWAAGAFGLLSALVWPLAVRALLLVPALVLGLLVFFLNGSLLLIALSVIPEGRGEADPQMAVVVAAVMSAVASATSTALTVGDDEAYRRRLSRLAQRRRGGRRDEGRHGMPGTLFLQLDGLGHDTLRRAVDQGLMPTVARLLGRTAAAAPRTSGRRSRVPAVAAEHPSMALPTHRLTPWRTDWSSQTGASQLGILHGSNHDVPAFRWYEKESGRTMVCSSPASTAELQNRAIERTGDGGLLTIDGASRGNLFSGGADQLALVLSIAARRGPSNRSRAGYFAYFSDPANAVRTAMSFVAEVVREIHSSVRSRLRKETPRVGRGGLYPFIRAFATVVERDVVVSAVMGDLLSGRTAIYADLVAYDEVAHHSGPRSRDADLILKRLDRSLALITKIADRAPRAYRTVLLSDHGQSPGETFEGRYGLTLRDYVRASCGLPVPRRAQRTRSGAEARDAVLTVLHRPVSGTREAPFPVPPEADGASDASRLDPIVLASGNLGLISFPDIAGRASREEIDRRHPALLRMLAGHPGIGFLLVRSEEHGAVVLGPEGAVVPLAELRDDEGPMRPFGPGAADAVRRTDGFPHTADIMVNSSYDPGTGQVHAFEEQIGSHGGLGGEQTRPFLLWPLALSDPVAEGAEIVGAERVHQVLRRWLRECQGPQVPVGPAQDSLSADPAEGGFPAPDRAVQDEKA